MACKAHEGQMSEVRRAVYHSSPLCRGSVLAELELDKETIVAGILHDVVEDTEYTLEDITREFTRRSRFLLTGVTKLGQLSYSHDKMDIQGGEPP